jgi:hypothetical protein
VGVGKWKAAALPALLAAVVVAPAWGVPTVPDGLVAADGSAAYVAATVACGASGPVSVQLALLQGDARGVGTARATCTRGVVKFTMLVVTSKGALGVGPAMGCYEVDAARASARGCAAIKLRR